MLAIKESVDTDQRPGRFLLTGSANLMAVPAIGHSLAGRMAVIPLLPLAQAEISRAPGRFLGVLFSKEPVALQGETVTGQALMSVVLAGGYPEVLKRRSFRRRQAWLNDYLALVLDRDVRDVASIDQLKQLPSTIPASPGL